jgi:anion-transporting  ArsA/GET3 family ATPase
MATAQPLFHGARLHVVTGKGGTGKTTVAAALALSLAAGGRRVLLVEVEGRQGIARLFDTAPLPYEEKKIASARDRGEVFALAIDPEAALLDYLEMFYNLRRAGSALKRMGAVDFATTVAPGLRDVLLTGKTCEAVRRVTSGKPAYDAVVMDAPPTGRIAQFLNVNSEVAGLAKVGPIKNQADSVMRVIRSSSTKVHLVTLLEEMPVQETIDAVNELRDENLPVGGVVVNQTQPPALPDTTLTLARNGKLTQASIERGLVAAGISATIAKKAAPGLALEARRHADRVELQQQERERLSALQLPTAALPYLSDGIDLGGLYELAEQLHDQGFA